MATDNPQIVGYPPQPVYDRLIEFKETHGFKSDSQALIAVLKDYFGLKSACSSLEVDSIRTGELEQTVNHHTQQLTDHTEKLSALSQQLSVLSQQLSTKGVKSLKPTQLLAKPHNAIYGRGEAASTYPGWEFSANVSYVFDRFQILNTDDGRAAFADKWIGLCAQSLSTALVVCYQLLSIIKEKEMYKISLWMEGNKSYDSFKDYFEGRFKQPFDNWLKLELTHKFIIENSPEFLEALSNIANSCDQGQNSIAKEQFQSQPEVSELETELLSESTKELQSAYEVEIDNSRSLDPQNASNELVGSTKIKPLSGSALSKRLNIPNSSFRRNVQKKSQSELAEWTRSKDPDGISWAYSRKSKKFHPHD